MRNPEKITKESLLKYKDEDELNNRIKGLEQVVDTFNRAIYTPIIIIILIFFIDIIFRIDSNKIFSISIYLIIINSIVIILAFKYPWEYILIKLRQEAHSYKSKAISSN